MLSLLWYLSALSCKMFTPANHCCFNLGCHVFIFLNQTKFFCVLFSKSAYTIFISTSISFSIFSLFLWKMTIVVVGRGNHFCESTCFVTRHINTVPSAMTIVFLGGLILESIGNSNPVRTPKIWKSFPPRYSSILQTFFL